MRTKYLLLRFKNATLRYSDGEKTPSGAMTLDVLKNTDRPIGLGQMSGMIHAMFSLPPKPSKRDSLIVENEELVDLAKNSYIKYDMSGGRIGIYEFFKAKKWKVNSHSKIKDVINGYEFSGHYCWAYFKKCFDGCENLLNEILSFFNNVVGCDVCSIGFNDFLEKFWEHLDDDIVKDFFENTLRDGGDYCSSSGGKPLTKPWISVLKRDVENGASNGSYCGKTPLVLSGGIGYEASFSGKILIPIDKEWMIDWLIENGRIPTLLDGGVVKVLSLSDYPPSFDFEDEYERICDE